MNDVNYNLKQNVDITRIPAEVLAMSLRSAKILLNFKQTYDTHKTLPNVEI